MTGKSSNWKIYLDPGALSDLRKLDRPIRKRILDYLEKKIAPSKDPRLFARQLHGQFRHLWRFRVGDYRIFAQIQDRMVRVWVIRIGHRKEVYK